MRKLIAAINMTLDGFGDHTAITPDEEIHQHYTDLLHTGDAILYGRTTYQLMEFWQPIVKNPSGNPAMDDFALAIDKIPKIVFSHTLQKLEWDTARLAKQGLKEEILSLKAQTGKDLFIGCPSLIVQAINLNLLDELQLCVHPVLAGKGIPLFKNLQPGVELTLLKTKTFDSGAVILYYAPTTVAQD